MSNTEIVEIREALDEAQAELNSLAFKSLKIDPNVLRDSGHFWQNDPLPGLPVERIEQRDDMIGLRLNGIEEIEDRKLVRVLANFLRDEFLFRVQRSIHSENVRRRLSRASARRIISWKGLPHPEQRLQCATPLIHSNIRFHLIAMCSELWMCSKLGVVVCTSAPSI